MIVQLTAAGQALLEGNTGPVTVTSFQLGSAYGYIPEPSDTGIHGTLIYTGVPSSPLAVSANLVVYSSYLDYDLGPFEFGEIGLFVGTTLFALATGSVPISKLAPNAGTSGNAIRIDEYVSVVGTNYQMWLNLAESSNAFQMAVLTSPDLLPQSSQAIPNAYVISGVVNSQVAFLAYTDKLGLWNFDAYQYGSQVSAPITASDSQSVTIALDDYVSEMDPQYFGQVILEFTSGALYSTCRYVQTAITSGNFVTLGFDSQIAKQPAVGDTITVFVRMDDTELQPIPPATTAELGGVIVGQYLTVQPNGLLAVNAAILPYPVTSVNSQTGAVVIQAEDANPATGTSLITDSGATDGTIKLKTIVAGTSITLAADANGNIQVNNTYTLPIASLTTLGGVKAPADGNITISGTGVIDLGFTPVTSVDGLTGAVVLPLATTSSTGLMQVGSGLQVTDGVVSVNTSGQVTSVDGQTGAVIVKAQDNSDASGLTLITDSGATTGVIKLKTIVQGTGVTVGTDANGNMQISTPFATTSTAGSVIVGTGLSIASGVLSVTAVGGVTSVSGQTGAVVVEAVDNSDASGTSLISNSGSTTGVIKLKTLVAGTNIGLTSDGNGNLVISSTGSSGVTSFNSRTGAVTLQGSDISGAGGALVAAANAWTGANNFTGGSINVTTQTAGNNSTLAASTAFVAAAVSGSLAAVKYYDVVGGAAGQILSSQLVCLHVAVRTINIPANFVGSEALALNAPTAAQTLTVAVNGTTVGTISFAASATTGTFATSGGAVVTITPGQYISITAGVTADTTFANLAITLLGLAS